MKFVSAEAAAAWLIWFGAALLVVAGILVVAAIVLTRSIDDLARTATVAGALALPGLIAIVIGRMSQSPKE
jgi:hypothetical protein